MSPPPCDVHRSGEEVGSGSPGKLRYVADAPLRSLRTDLGLDDPSRGGDVRSPGKTRSTLLSPFHPPYIEHGSGSSLSRLTLHRPGEERGSVRSRD